MEELEPDESRQADPDAREEPASGLVKEQRELLELIAEERANSGAQPRPDQRPDCIVEEKRRGTHAHNSSQWRCHSAESRDELCQQQGARSVPVEEILRVPHAGVRFEGQPAQEAQHLPALHATQVVPG